MIRTETSWQDSGHDCDHCGGRILERTDQETGQAPAKCYQCELCACQWTLEGEVLRVGNGPECKAAQAARAGTGRTELDRRLLWVVAAMAVLLLLRLGGTGILRFLIPILLLAAAGYVLLRFGRQQEWW